MRFLSRPRTKVVERLLFIHFGLGPLFGFILCGAKNFPLFPSSLSLSLSLSFDYIYVYIREEVKEVLFKTGGGRLEESLFSFLLIEEEEESLRIIEN